MTSAVNAKEFLVTNAYPSTCTFTGHFLTKTSFIFFQHISPKSPLKFHQISIRTTCFKNEGPICLSVCLKILNTDGRKKKKNSRCLHARSMSIFLFLSPVRFFSAVFHPMSEKIQFFLASCMHTCMHADIVMAGQSYKKMCRQNPQLKHCTLHKDHDTIHSQLFVDYNPLSGTIQDFLQKHSFFRSVAK